MNRLEVASIALTAALLQAGPVFAQPVSEDQVSSGAPSAVSSDQVQDSPGAPARLAEPPSAGAASRPARITQAEQVGGRSRSVSPAEQLTARGRTATPPPALSTRDDGRRVGMVVVHGHDRCDPVRGEATREECALILDNRADQFAKPAPPQLSPEDALLSAPPSTDLAVGATAAQRLSGPEGADPSVAAAAAAVEGSPNGAQAAAVGATDRNAPAVPVGTFPNVPAPANGGPTVTVTGPR